MQIQAPALRNVGQSGQPSAALCRSAAGLSWKSGLSIARRWRLVLTPLEARRPGNTLALYVLVLTQSNSVERPRRARGEEAPREDGLVLLDRDAVGQRRDPLVEVGLGHAVLHHFPTFLVADVQHRREVR